jgi:hypothetical protein
MKNPDFIPNPINRELGSHYNHGPQPSFRSGSERQVNDRIQAGEVRVRELLDKFGEGTTLADLGEPGIHIKRYLDELIEERGHGGGDSIAKLARLIEAIKEIELPTLH